MVSRSPKKFGKILAVIPAYDDPDVYLTKLGSWSLLARSINLVSYSTYCDDITCVVLTNSTKVRKEAKYAYSQVIFHRNLLERPVSDFHPEPMVWYTLEHLRASGAVFDAVALISARFPVCTIQTLDKCLSAVLEDGKAGSFTGYYLRQPLWEPEIGQVGIKGSKRYPSYKIDQRPDPHKLHLGTLPFVENGAIYVAKAEVWDKTQTRLPVNPGISVEFVEMPYLASIEVNTPTDLLTAEFVLSLANSGKLQ